jgi:Xaa-Pro aminopeptidase
VSSIYKKRRDKIAKKLKPNSVAIIYSATLKQRSNDTSYPFRQSSNFFYLTGFLEDNSALVLTKDKSTLFVQKKEPLKELWDGKRLGVDRAKELFEVDEVFEYDETSLREMANGASRLYVEFEDKRALDFLKNEHYELKNLSKMIQKLRLIKSKSEIKTIKKAISITAKAHKKAMKMSKTNRFEYELQALIEYTFKKNGSYSDAYTTIVASGNNANTLHYIKNSKKMKKGELVLIDAGCEYKSYASDITRTLPVSTKFTKAQKDIYNLVLASQKKAIKLVKPDAARSQMQQKIEGFLEKGLVRLGFNKGSIKRYFPHGLGHWMGLDVHDMAPYRTKKGKEIPLKKGMLLTIEPALYIDKNDKEAPKKYRGIGIRIEDNILVTKNGYKNLSKMIPKEIDEIERFG